MKESMYECYNSTKKQLHNNCKLKQKEGDDLETRICYPVFSYDVDTTSIDTGSNHKCYR